MISNFSSLIELFAALYLTFSLDDILLRRFWSTDYKMKVRAELNKIKMPEFVKEKTYKKTMESSLFEERKLRKRGALILGLCLSLLIMIGFSDHLLYLKTDYKSILLIILLTLTSIFYCFDGLFLRSWWCVFFSIFLIPIFSFWMVNYSYVYITEFNLNCIYLVIFAKTLMVVMLVSPVLWQLFRNWFYTRYYLVYISDEARKKVKKYKVALNYNKSVSINSVAKNYRDIAVDNLLKKDRNITVFVNTLQDDLLSIVYVPSLSRLIKSSISSYRRRHPERDTLKELYEKFLTKSNKDQIKEFCEEEYLDTRYFKKYIYYQEHPSEWLIVRVQRFLTILFRI